MISAIVLIAATSDVVHYHEQGYWHSHTEDSELAWLWALLVLFFFCLPVCYYYSYAVQETVVPNRIRRTSRASNLKAVESENPISPVIKL